MPLRCQEVFMKNSEFKSDEFNNRKWHNADINIFSEYQAFMITPTHRGAVYRYWAASMPQQHNIMAFGTTEVLRSKDVHANVNWCVYSFNHQ